MKAKEARGDELVYVLIRMVLSSAKVFVAIHFRCSKILSWKKDVICLYAFSILYLTALVPISAKIGAPE